MARPWHRIADASPVAASRLSPVRPAALNSKGQAPFSVVRPAGALPAERLCCCWHAAGRRDCRARQDRKSVVEGKSVSVRVDLGGRRIIKKKNIIKKHKNPINTSN